MPNISHHHQLENLQCGDQRSQKFRQSKSEMIVHHGVHETVQEHAALLRAGKHHHQEKEEKRRGMMVDMQKSDLLQRLSFPAEYRCITPLPYL